jgi:hypothetical protein
MPHADEVKRIENWDEFFKALAGLLRGRFHARFPFKNDGDVSPETLGLRDAFHAFPCPTEVLLVDTEGASHPRSEGRYWTLICYDLSKLGTLRVTFHNVVRLAEFSSLSPLLKTSFNLHDDDSIRSIQCLNLASIFDTEVGWFVDFSPYDVRDRIQDYARELFESLLLSVGDTLIRQFKKDIDFKTVYGLQEDPPLTTDQLLDPDPVSRMFVNALTGEPHGIADRYSDTRGILLIPPVPESVQRTFNLAKRLYVYGCLEYGFFTISTHYAYLALEAAVHARWSASLPSKATVEYERQKEEINAPTHTSVFRLCQDLKWDVRKVRVNGTQFPHSSKRVLDWLVANRVLTNWQADRVRFGLRMRNTLSHLEFATVDGPRSHTLRFVAELINMMFHKLPTG